MASRISFIFSNFWICKWQHKNIAGIYAICKEVKGRQVLNAHLYITLRCSPRSNYYNFEEWAVVKNRSLISCSRYPIHDMPNAKTFVKFCLHFYTWILSFPLKVLLQTRWTISPLPSCIINCTNTTKETKKVVIFFYSSSSFALVHLSYLSLYSLTIVFTNSFVNVIHRGFDICSCYTKDPADTPSLNLDNAT